MKSPMLISLVVICICGLTAAAQQPQEYENFRDASLSSVRAHFMLRSVPVVSVLTKKAMLGTPDWTPKEPLPISISNAVVIAEAEIGRYATFEPVTYEVKHVLVKPFPGTQNKKWYFMIAFNRIPNAANNDPMILVDFSGHVGGIESEIPGKKLVLK